MGDLRDILQANPVAAAAAAKGAKKKKASAPAAKKPKGMSREVFNLTLAGGSAEAALEAERYLAEHE